MAKYKIILLYLLICLPITAFGQSFTGTITDSQNNIPLPYASIGVKGKGIGGIVDSKGHFLLNITGATSLDTIIVSYLGYQSKTFVKLDISIKESFLSAFRNQYRPAVESLCFKTGHNTPNG